MSEFYTWVIFLISQLDEIGEKKLSVFGFRGGQICSLMHVALFGFRSIRFEVMHRFHFKFTEGYSIIKYRSGLNLEIIRKFLTELWPFFDLGFG